MLAVSYCIILDIQNWIMPTAFFTHLFLIYQRWIYFPGIGARKLPAFWQRLVSSSWTRCIQDPSAPESHPTCLSNTYAVSLQKKKKINLKMSRFANWHSAPADLSSQFSVSAAERRTSQDIKLDIFRVTACHLQIKTVSSLWLRNDP